MNDLALPRTIKLDHSMRMQEIGRKLAREIEGEVSTDRAARGRYATDASIYQIMPLAVVVPKTQKDVDIALQFAREERLPVLPRGGGTSQCGQTVGEAIVLDNSKWLRSVVHYEPGATEIEVEPGMVLDSLNQFLKPYGVWFAVDVSTSAQATIGGMAGNNSCGSRSIAYGNMVHNVAAIEATLGTGETLPFGLLDGREAHAGERYQALAAAIRGLLQPHQDEIAKRFPRLLRRVAGYNLDIFNPQDPLGYATTHANLAHLLVGSEGTLAYFRKLRLKLSPLPEHKVLGVVNFPRFYDAMAMTQHIVTLKPSAVELVDRTMIELARNNPLFRPVIDQALIGTPDAILLVEFSGSDHRALLGKLTQLALLMDDLGFPASVIQMPEARAQKALWDVRKAGLNIMMSMKGEGKPVSFIEDCCVPLEHLADYTQQLTEVFDRHGTRGTWYAHASVGTLHVRPILNMRADGADKMRAIAHEACALVQKFKGVYSGEHGDGLVRSEWIQPFFGPQLTPLLGDIKKLFDPAGLMNPGKIVNPPRFDDRSLFRFSPDYVVPRISTALDWSRYEVDESGLSTAAPSRQGLVGAIEMCNNNGHCRKFDAGTMCPSYRVTRDEQHLTRGRANTLRLAVSGQLGPEGLASDAVKEAMSLCVSCKGCRSDCPTGVDMARMKIEFLHAFKAKQGLTLRDRLVAATTTHADWLRALTPLVALRNRVPLLAKLMAKGLGLSWRRSLPLMAKKPALSTLPHVASPGDQPVVLFVDTFNNQYEPDTAVAAHTVLTAAGYRVTVLRAGEGERPLCCGRTLLASGQVEAARVEARRMLTALEPFASVGVPIVGLEPACLYTLRDEWTVVGLGPEATRVAALATLFDAFVLREIDVGRFRFPQKADAEKVAAVVHAHCHQKAFGEGDATATVLRKLGWADATTIESSCCGMAGAFGYEAEHYETSMAMGELSLFPAIRKAPANATVVACGTSCRDQIADGTGRRARHLASVLAAKLESLHGDQ